MKWFKIDYKIENGIQFYFIEKKLLMEQDFYYY